MSLCWDRSEGGVVCVCEGVCVAVGGVRVRRDPEHINRSTYDCRGPVVASAKGQAKTKVIFWR